ncbi:hypothetical protein [Paenibacillus psychroresistens]|uniref:hypothetical protein n=1 Tax=Paenibacillus psychroresistens TaxID=1778678 RepID=UPI0012DA3CFC|nr:hypothetical protein [Paenibacillus psychroresistens]
MSFYLGGNNYGWYRNLKLSWKLGGTVGFVLVLAFLVLISPNLAQLRTISISEGE